MINNNINDFFVFVPINVALSYKINKLGQVINSEGALIKCFTRGHYKGYTLTNNDGIRKFYSMHRLIATHFIPNPYNYPVIDHIDRNKLNNCFNNLRWATYAMNSQNRPKCAKNTLGKNIMSFSKRWRVQIQKNGNMIFDKSFHKDNFTLENVKSIRNQIYLNNDLFIFD